MTGDSNRTVLVPVKFLEHSRFRLRDPSGSRAPARARASPATCCSPGSDEGSEPGAGRRQRQRRDPLRGRAQGRRDRRLAVGGAQASRPQAQAHRRPWTSPTTCAKAGTSAARARASTAAAPSRKRSSAARSRNDPVPITNDDLRFRQLVKRATPATNAAVIFALDVSGSMDEAQRQPRQAVLLLRAAGHPPPVQQGRDRVPRPRRARPGSSTRASSSRRPRAAAPSPRARFSSRSR